MTERTARELEHEGDRTRSRSGRGSRIGEGGALAPGDCGHDCDCDRDCRSDGDCGRGCRNARAGRPHSAFSFGSRRGVQGFSPAVQAVGARRDYES